MRLSNVVILPYKMASRSAKELAIRLTNILGRKVRRVRARGHGGNYEPNGRSRVINYGFIETPQWLHGDWLNRWPYAASKLTAFQKFKEAGIPTPEWTTNIEEAQQWSNAGKMVVCRHLLTAHSGRGITLVSNGPVPQAPLYVLYKKKRREFRVHVFRGEVIDVSEKRKRRGFERDNGYIRNLACGWVFCRDDIVEPADLRDLASRAVQALGLDFGACDIIWNERENKCYVLEVNTAPGLEGTTLNKYVEAIYKWISSK